MITVIVEINGKPIIIRNARNISEPEVVADKNFPNLYKCDDGRRIEHKPADGAAQLAIKILEGVENP